MFLEENANKIEIVRDGLKSIQVIAYDDVSTSGSIYFQYSDKTIKKWGADNIRYSAPNGTLWSDRTTATYTAETV